MARHQAIITLLLISQLLTVVNMSPNVQLPGQTQPTSPSSQTTTITTHQMTSNCLSPSPSDLSQSTFQPSKINATLTGTVLPRVHNGTAVRRLQQISQTLVIHMQFIFKIRNPDQFDKCYESIMDPTSSDYEHFLNATTLQPYLPTPGQVSSVISYLRGRGFTVNYSSSPIALELSAPVETVQRTFGATLSLYDKGNYTFYAINSDPIIPQSIASLAEGILGLDNSTRVRTLDHPSSLLRECWGDSISPYCAPALQVGYSMTSLINGNPKYDGTGERVAVVIGQDEPDPQTAINTFDSEFGLPATTLTILCVSSSQAVTCPTPQPPYAYEGDLDMESVHTMAPGAQIIIVHPVDGNSIGAINYIANNHIAAIVSNSYSLCADSHCTLLKDSDFTSGFRNPIDAFLRNDAIQGLTILFASGDQGATPDGSTAGLGVEFPASDLNVLSVGGTDLTLTGCGINTCTGYGSEDGWSGSGGGYSTVENEPSWQLSTLGTTTGRAVPDVSMFAGTPNVWAYNTQLSWAGVWGTSLATPLWAGVLAVALQRRGGGAFGNIDPLLYQLASSSSYSTYFHDIQGTGNNNGYSVGRGWDAVTGWGTPVGNNLASALVGISVSTDKGTYTQGQSVQYSATGLTASGTVQSCLSTANDGSLLCIAAPNAADGYGDVSGSMQVGTNIPAGPQKFLVLDVATGRWSNDVQLTILASGGSADFALSASPPSLTLNVPSSGITSGTSTITISSENGWISQVSLSGGWGNNVPTGVTFGFNPNPPPAPPSGGTVTSTLTVTVSSSAASGGEGTFQLTITGQNGAVQHSIVFPVTINPAPPTATTWPKGLPGPFSGFTVPANAYVGVSIANYGEYPKDGFVGFIVPGNDLSRSGSIVYSSSFTATNTNTNEFEIVDTWNSFGNPAAQVVICPAGYHDHLGNSCNSYGISDNGPNGKYLIIYTSVIVWGPPTSLTATAASSAQINLAWTSNTGGAETSFRIERATSSSGPFAEVASVGTGVLSYQDTGLTADTTYYYQVRAYSSNYLAYTLYSSAGTADGSPVSATTFATTTVTAVVMTVSYSILGGGSPSPPIFGYVQGTVSKTYTLTTSPASISVDSGSSWSVTPNPLSGSSSTEQWQSNQALSGTASNSVTIVFTFYHQYLLTVSYSILGGGTGYSPPTFTANSYGASAPQTMTGTPTGYWYDSGSSRSVTNPLIGSTGSEGWSLSIFYSLSPSGTVSSAGPMNFVYYHQYLLTLSYSVVGGGVGYSAPMFSARYLGSGIAGHLLLTTTATGYWYDAGSGWSVDNPLGGSTSSEQWVTSQTSGTVSSPQTLTFSYTHQFTLTIQVSPSGGGTAAPATGWQNAGATILVTETFNPGYSFYYWSLDGSNVGTGSSYSVLMNTAHTLTALFLASSSISLTASPATVALGASVTLSGAISPAQPSGNTVTLSYSLDGGATWNIFITTQIGGSGTYSTIWYSPYPGTYQIKASWSGNANYAGSASSPASLTVTGTETPSPALLLSAPSTGSHGQSVRLLITVFNPANSILTASVTIELTGPSNYVAFDVVQLKVAATSQSTAYYDWTVPNQSGTYVVVVGLLPPKPTAFDTATIQIT